MNYSRYLNEIGEKSTCKKEQKKFELQFEYFNRKTLTPYINIQETIE